jgi:hypothetical protein
MLRRLRPQIDARALGLLFGLTLALGTIARAWHGPTELLDHASRWPTAALAALSANLINNLPAAVLFSAQAPPHPRALLLGLNLGPNLAITGSLSAYLWLQAAKATNAQPSIRTYSRLGLMLVPLTLAATLGALSTPLKSTTAMHRPQRVAVPAFRDMGLPRPAVLQIQYPKLPPVFPPDHDGRRHRSARLGATA